MNATALSLALITATSASLHSAEIQKSTNQLAKATASNPMAAVLPAAKWQQVESSVDRALAWM